MNGQEAQVVALKAFTTAAPVLLVDRLPTANSSFFLSGVEGTHTLHSGAEQKIPQGFTRGEELQRGHWPPSARVRMREEQGGVGAAPEDEGGGTAEASGAVLDSLCFFVCAHSCANTGNKCSLGSSVSVKSATARTTSTPGMARGPICHP